MHLYRTCHLAVAVYACTSRPSTFRADATTEVLFNSYMLCLYRPISCINRRYTGYILFGGRFCISHLYIAKSTSTILRPLLKKATKFTIGYFKFQIIFRGAFERYADFSAYDVSYEGVILTFHLVLVEAAVD